MEEGIQPTALGLSEASRDFVAGGVGGMCGVLAGQPLDTVRIRQQQPGTPLSSALHVFRGIISGEGTSSLFKGMTGPLVTSTFQNAVCFHSYGAASRYITGDAAAATGPLPYQHVFLAGSFAGLVQTAVVVPVDLLKIRLQLQTAVPGMAQYLGPLAMLRQVLRVEGLRGLFRGSAITIIRDTPSYGIYYASFEMCREGLDPGSRQSKSSSPLTLWAAGGVAGVVSWTSVYALDLIKSRIQATTARDSPYTGWVDCALKSYREEGWRVFFRGFGATIGRAFLVNGAIFTAYELSHQALLGLEQSGQGLGRQGPGEPAQAQNLQQRQQ